MDAAPSDDDLLIPAGRHTLDPEEVRTRQRVRLLRAMGICVSEKGYVETNIGDVVRVARTSRTAFYEHFADKEACFLDTYGQATRTLIGWSLSEAEASTAWRERLRVGIGSYFRWMSEHPELAVTTVVEVHRAGRRALDARAQALDDWSRSLRGVAELAAEAGEPVHLEDVVYRAILLASESYVHEYARRGETERVIERASLVQEFAMIQFESGLAST
jgi:AcrR family transcriptional regulator